MIEKTARENLLLIAREYARATGLSLATISKEMYGNQAFLQGFEQGKQSIRLSKLDEMLVKFSDKWPRGAKWPVTKPLSMAKPSSTGRDK